MSLRDLRPLPPVTPELTLVLLHHAGGSSSSFIPFAPLLPPDWRLLAVDLPGRLFAPAQRSCRSSTEAVAYLLSVLRPELSGPCAVFGHSMGALLGYELVRALERQGASPRWLGVSGCPAPQIIGRAPGAVRGAAWSSRQLLRFAHGLGGTPAGSRHGGPVRPGRTDDRPHSRSDNRPHRSRGPSAERIEERIGERIAQTLRNDLTIVDGYEYVAGPPLRAALSVFRGDVDPLAPREFTEPWADHAGDAVSFHSWPGGHFFVFERAAEVCARMVRTCRPLLRR